MRRITLWLLSTISALVLLFSYSTSSGARTGTSVSAPANADQAATSTDTASGTTGDAATGSTSSGNTATTPTPTPSASSGASATTPPAGATYAGTAINTRYGPVQVQITVAGGKITKSIVLQVPWNNGKDQQINGYAVPILNKEAVAAQSSGIDMVSGATYTSDGYIQSLQSALDQAHL